MTGRVQRASDWLILLLEGRFSSSLPGLSAGGGIEALSNVEETKPTGQDLFPPGGLAHESRTAKY